MKKLRVNLQFFPNDLQQFIIFIIQNLSEAGMVSWQKSGGVGDGLTPEGKVGMFNEIISIKHFDLPEHHATPPVRRLKDLVR